MKRIFKIQILTIVSILFSLTFTVSSQESARTTIAGWTFPTSQPSNLNRISASCQITSGSVMITDGSVGSTSGIIGYETTGGVKPSSSLCGVTSATGSVAVSSMGSIVFKLSTKGYCRLKLNFYEKTTPSKSGMYNLSYSVDGTNYKSVTAGGQGIPSAGTSFSNISFDLSGIVELDNKDVVYIKLTISDKSGGVTNHFDNFNFNAAPASVFCDRTYIGFGNSTTSAVVQTFNLNPTSGGGKLPALTLKTSGAFTLSKDGTNFSNRITIQSGSPTTTIYVKYDPLGLKGTTFSTIDISGSGATFNNNSISVTGSNSTFFEGFETPNIDNNNNSMTDVVYGSGKWKVSYNVTDAVSDRYVGLRGVRLQNPSDGVEMLVDKSNGAGVVSFLYSTFGMYPSGANLKVEYSIDQGLNWTQVSTIIGIPAWSGKMNVGTVTINDAGSGKDGNIRIRIMKTQSNNSPINIDNVSITDYVVPTVIGTTSSVEFGNKALNITSELKFNLYVKGLESKLDLVSDSPYFTVSPNSIAQNFIGDQEITITFNPTTTADYRGNLTLLSSKINKVINLSGYGVNGSEFDVTYGFDDVNKPDQHSSNHTANPSNFHVFPSPFSAVNLSNNNVVDDMKHFYFDGWSTTGYDNKYYEFFLEGDKDGDEDDFFTLSSLSFDVIIPASSTLKYKVEYSNDGTNFSELPATFDGNSSLITTAGNEFDAVGASSSASKISGSKIILDGISFIDKEKFIFRFYAYGEGGLFGVDNVRVVGFMNNNESPTIIISDVDKLVTFKKEGDVVTPSSQTIKVEGDGIPDGSSISVEIVGDGFSFTKSSGWNDRFGGNITIEYNNTSNGEHEAMLKVGYTDVINHSVKLLGVTIPEKYIFIGTVDDSWSNSENWENNLKPEDVDDQSKIVIRAPVVLFGLIKIICGEIEITERGSLTLRYNANIQINSKIFETGKLKVESQGLVKMINGESNSVTMLFGSAVTHPPVVTVIQQMETMGDGDTGTVYQIISSPVGEISNADVCTRFDGAFLDRFSEIENKWERFGEKGLAWGDVNRIEPNRGYSVSFENPQEVVFDGSLAAPVDVTYSTTYTTSPGGNGYNLLGNPFSGTIDLSTMGSWTGFAANYNDVIYLWNRSGNYEAITSSIQSGAGVIPMGQGFWVIQKEGSSHASFAIPYSAVGTKKPNQPLMKSSIYDEDHVILNINGGGFSDRFQLYEISGCSNSYDESYDAYKWMGSEDAPQLYSVMDNSMFSIDSRDDISSTNLNFIAGVETMYTITAEYKIGDRGLYLVDNKMGHIHNFANGSISFSASKSDDINRFKLVVGDDPKNVKDNVMIPDYLKIWSYGKNVYIVGETDNAIIYDMQGRIVSKFVVKGEQKIVNIDKPGLYVVRANGISRKIIIN